MTMETRRTFISAMSLAAAAAPFISTTASAADNTAATIPAAFANTHSPRPLLFDPAQLDGLSPKLINSHWENNYGGSVRALNAVKERLQTALGDDAAPPYIYTDLKREHLLRTGSVVLHEYYFDNMAPSAARNSEFDRDIAKAFGSVESWDKEFRRIGAGLGGGSGWVLLGWNFHTQTLENFWMWDHMHSPAATVPLLVMDMYEHSYQMDYGAAAAQYIDAFFANASWDVVERRFAAAQRARAALAG